MPTTYSVRSSDALIADFKSILVYRRNTDQALPNIDVPANVVGSIISSDATAVTVNASGLATFQKKMLIYTNIQLTGGRTAGVGSARVFARLLFNNNPLTNFENVLLFDQASTDNYFAGVVCSCFLNVAVNDTLRVQAWPDSAGTATSILYAAPCTFTGNNAPSFIFDIDEVNENLS